MDRGCCSQVYLCWAGPESGPLRKLSPSMIHRSRRTLLSPEGLICIEMAAATRAGFWRMFSVSAFAPPPPPAARPTAEPCNNLFVSGLNKHTTSEKLMEAFSKFGQVTEARVVTDRISGYSRGGFVKYATVREAGEGIKDMDGKFLDGWVIFAEYVKPREAPPTPPPGYQ